MGVQDRDWYRKDREAKERRAERDPRTTEYDPKQFRGSRRVESQAKGTHWLVQVVWWIAAALTLRLAYLFVITM